MSVAKFLANLTFRKILVTQCIISNVENKKLLSFLSSPLKRFGKHCEIFNSRILAVCFFGRAYSVAVKRMMCAYSPCCLAQVEFPSCMYLFLQSTSVVTTLYGVATTKNLLLKWQVISPVMHRPSSHQEPEYVLHLLLWTHATKKEKFSKNKTLKFPKTWMYSNDVYALAASSQMRMNSF